MPRGEAQLGSLAVAWDVPDAFPEAVGGLEHLAAGSPARATWSVRTGDPGAPPARFDAFYGPVLLDVAEADAVHVWSPVARLVVRDASVEGVVRGHAALPASIALHALAAYAGLVHVHAALVSIDGIHVLAPGGSGAGKTSFALAAALDGELHADDVTYVDDARRAWPVRRPPHVTASTLAAHPALSVIGPVLDGFVSKLRVEPPGVRRPPPFAIDALLLPTLGDGPTRIEPIDGPEAFAHLVGASALAVVEGTPRRDAMLDVLARLAELPAARLVAGRDALLDPRVLPTEARRWLRTLA